ncbi:hypothetical protein MNR01_08895 [Lysobacter sp. S4-A87]|uniref:hypothetical protein n=1 Tax=Lysobacter sp. S4-A87 TaxID=2925843 RepID=UPI001F531008|nr:hypothetical protein [Lysobacter sp. S4-A87]UNK47910.1 hypothetical protein MNR01_08895 [Lysobacter sp. S4-A87]
MLIAALRDWWPLLAAIALLLWLLIAWRNSRNAERERRDAAARPRTITWAQVKTPDAQSMHDVADFTLGNLPLPEVAVAMHMSAPRPSTPSPSSTTLRHDAARSASVRTNAIDFTIDAPLVLSGALPSCVSWVNFEHITPPTEAAPTRRSPIEAIEPDDVATINPIEEETVNKNVGMGVSAPAEASTMDASERVGQAKHWLTADRPEQALSSLAPLLDGGDASGEAWTVAGWSWWRIARDRPDRQLEAAVQAASAFRNALRVEPDRANLLSRMIARCHQMQARRQTGTARLASLDEAIAVYDRHLQGHTRDDAVLLEWAEALHERAAASPRDERAHWLDRSERVIDQRWGTTMSDAGEPVQWLWINLMLARAELVDLRSAGVLQARGATLLHAGIARWDAPQRDAWLTRLIESERAYAQRLSGAARIARLQATQTGVEGPLAATRIVEPLLAWIGLLGDWSASLHGTAAQAKLNEAEALFARIEAISPEDGAQAQFAHAYYLRMRARREFGLTRWHTLEQALTLLAGIAPGELPPALVDLEAAEIHLEQARLTEGVPQHSHLASAARLAETAAQAPENEARALLCALKALVAIALSPAQLPAEPRPQAAIRMKQLASRLLDLAPNDADALQIVASVHLTSDEPRAASELCAAAWEAGAARADLMPIWRQADARWTSTLDPAGQDPHWKRLNQSMRMANTTL